MDRPSRLSEGIIQFDAGKKAGGKRTSAYSEEPEKKKPKKKKKKKGLGAGTIENTAELLRARKYVIEKASQ